MSDEHNASIDALNTKVNEHEESFAEMLEKSLSVTDRIEPGHKVRARVISISGDLVYIDLGGKSDGVIGLNEFIKEDGTCSVREGDEITAFFVSMQDGLRKLTTLVKGYSTASLSAVKAAFDAGIPINGDVKSEVKGGFEVSAGGVRCFCPFSQMDSRRISGTGDYLGKTFPFKVLEYREDGKGIVLSRRVLLEEERKTMLEGLKASLKVGMEVKGRVRSILNFGAFVDLGGMDGLIPASEMSWSRTEKISDLLSPGQEVTAKIISIDWDENRLALSMKAMQQDPWNAVPDKYPVGAQVKGVIVRLVPFGAFVCLEPGIDGLVHISNLGAGRRINHPKEVVQVGQLVEAYVLSVEPENRKLSLSMQPKAEPKNIEYPDAGELIDGIVEKIMPFGVFIKINEGVTGLVPNSEMGTPYGTDHNRMFPVGTAMQVVVLDVDKDAGRVTLSRKEVMSKEEQDEVRSYLESVKKTETSSGGMGALGEKLKAVMEKGKKIS